MKIVLGLLIVLVAGLLSLCLPSCRGCEEAVDVAYDEYGPKAMLAKYTWFKDASAQLDKKKADVQVYEVRLKGQDQAYTGIPRSQWPRDEREQRGIWETEVAGIRASYNALAAEYNAQMSKFNWRFANTGDLPPGATNPVPREYRNYEER